jgi:diguanylate cyclase (GGDEF)-like protein
MQNLTIGLYLMAAVVAAVACHYVWSRRSHSTLTMPMVAILGGIVEWSATEALSVAPGPLDWRQFWNAALFAGVGMVVVGFLWYASAFSGHPWPRSRPLVALLCLEPLATVVACATNPWTHLFYQHFAVTPSGALVVVAGPLFWVHSAYSYAFCLAALALVLRSSVASVAGHRRLHVLLLTSALPPTVGNVISMLNRTRMDVTPVAFLFTAGLWLWAERRGYQPRRVPLPASQVLAALRDAVVVLDAGGHVLDANPAALEILERLGSPAPGLFGRSWSAVAPPALAEILAGQVDTTLTFGAGQVLDVRLVSITGRNGQIRGTIVVLRDITEVERLRAELAEQAVRDGLSGLHNRRYLESSLTELVSQARQQGTPLAAVMIDIDHFKEVNDAHGHAAGDQILRRVASCLAGGLRAGEVIARFGGEEFVALLPGASALDAARRADHWRQACANLGLTTAAGSVMVTVSLGVADLPGDGSADALLARADEALYRAKAAGRNRVVLASDGPLLAGRRPLGDGLVTSTLAAGAPAALRTASPSPAERV